MLTFHEIIVGLGSNLPDNSNEKIEEALEWLRKIGWITGDSGTYETSPWNQKGGHDYSNRVVRLVTSMPLEQLVRESKRFEVEMGRTLWSRQQGIVPIDVDIVKYDSQILKPEELERDYFKIGYSKID